MTDGTQIENETPKNNPRTFPYMGRILLFRSLNFHDMIDHIKNYFQETTGLSAEMFKDDFLIHEISMAANRMSNALSMEKKIIAAGNGGSFCDAMHFASELTGKYKDIRKPLAAIALSDGAAMSCIANDFGYDSVFRRQLFGVATEGDIFLAISTSGKSQNILKAMESANGILGMTVIGLTGENTTDEFKNYCDFVIKAPGKSTNHIQECHIKIIHILVELIEKGL